MDRDPAEWPARTRESREHVDAWLVDLAAEHGPFTVREQVWDLTAAEYDAVLGRHEDGHAGGAGAWVTTDEAVLMVRHEGETAWSEPGGKREPGESFTEAAVRETREEAGVEVTVTGVLEVHPVTHLGPGERPPLVTPIVVFTADHVAGEPTPCPGEIAAARWWDERPADLLYEALSRFPLPG